MDYIAYFAQRLTHVTENQITKQLKEAFMVEVPGFLLPKVL